MPAGRREAVALVPLIAVAIVVACSSDYGENAAPSQGTSDGSLETSPTPPPVTDAGADASSCLADLGRDAKNCGRCGHDCLGGDCVAGVCQPVILVRAAGDSPFDTAGIAVDGSRVYWTVAAAGSGQALSCPLSGCDAPFVMTKPNYGGTPQGSLLVEGGDVFWTVGGALVHCPVGGASNGFPTEVCSGTNYASANDVASGGSGVFYVALQGPETVDGGSVQGGAIATTSLPSSCPGFLVTGLNGKPKAIRADSKNVYFTDIVHGQVLACPRTGCGTGPTVLGNVGDARHIAIDAKNLYVTAYGNSTVVQCPLTGCGANPPITMGIEQNGPLGIAIDETAVYWTNHGGGTVMRCAIGGCGANPTTIASRQASPGAIAVDHDAVYWLNGGTGAGDAEVMKLAK